jgi:hypothetical protein
MDVSIVPALICRKAAWPFFIVSDSLMGPCSRKALTAPAQFSKSGDSDVLLFDDHSRKLTSGNKKGFGHG